MNEHRPEEVHVLFAEAMNSGDLESLCDLYETEAKIVPQPGQSPIMGSHSIREFLKGFLRLRPHIDLETKSVILFGDIVLLHSRWCLRGIDPDGKPLEISGNGTEVVRLQPDGTWRFIIDHPWGAD